MSIAQRKQCSLELSARELRIGKREVRQGQHIDLVLLGHLDHGRGRPGHPPHHSRCNTPNCGSAHAPSSGKEGG